MDTLYVIVAKYFVLIPIVAVVYVWLRLPRRDKLSYAGFIVVGAIISLVLAKLGSHFINDPRPFVQGHFTPLISHVADNGFPSDHTLLAAFLAFAVLVKRHWLGVSLIVVAVLVGLSRMAVGVHHSWDILGSFVCAGIGVGLAWLLFDWLDHRRAADASSVKS